MTRKKTQSEKIAEQNKRAVNRMRQGVAESAQLQERVRAGELTAAQALRLKCVHHLDSLKTERTDGMTRTCKCGNRMVFGLRCGCCGRVESVKSKMKANQKIECADCGRMVTIGQKCECYHDEVKKKPKTLLDMYLSDV